MFYDARIQQNISGIDTNHVVDFFNALFQSIEKEKPLLVIGPGATQFLRTSNTEQHFMYWKMLFDAMISWCTENTLIEVQGVENELHKLLSKKDAWPSLGYRLEEFLPDRNEVQCCLKEVLQNTVNPSTIQLQLLHLPFRGFISTTYDLDIETTYEQIYHQKLPKFYGSSLQDTLDVCQQGHPFLLKLYGDIEHANSLVFGRRWAKGPICLGDHTALHALLSTSPVLFYGFDEDDTDFKYFKDVIEKHSPFNEMSITISEGIEEQLQDIENEGDTNNDLLSCSSSFILANAGEIAEVNKYSLLYTDYSKDLYYNSLSYNILTTIDENPVKSRLAGRSPIEIYTIYSEKDAKYYENMQNYVFSVLKSLNYNIACIENEIARSHEWRRKNHLLTARLILPLISLSFIGSNILESEQMTLAIDKHHKGDAYIIPILVHPADAWKSTTLSGLDALPDNGRAISKWSNKQDAYNNIVNYLVDLLNKISFGS